jgi:3' terminal RNA ribose 2'-O-methyltransferase Hen1
MKFFEDARVRDLPPSGGKRKRRPAGRGAAASDGSMMTQMTSLHELRLDYVFHKIKATGARRVLDLGCGSGSLLYRLCGDVQFQEIVGLEDSGQSLLQARSMLADHLGQTARLRLLRGSYAERQPELSGFDCAAMVETIEHVNPAALSRVEHSVFAGMRPATLFMTTPNREYNPLLDLAPGEFREPDHKFEWDRAKFRQWARAMADRNGYRVTFAGIGEYHPSLGQPTQTAFFEREK